MNTKRPEPVPKLLTDCPTAIELAEAVSIAQAVSSDFGLLIRRMAYQIDRYTNPVTQIQHPTSPPPPRKN